jgi:uncharacterized membrane protein YvlD (DUF360 family)
MTRIATLQRGAAVACIYVAVLLLAGFVVLAPDLDDPAGPLASIAASGAGGRLSAYAFLVGQLPWVVGMLGLAHVLRQRFRVLSPMISVLALVGGFGHAVSGGFALVQLSMADDLTHAPLHEAVMDRTYAAAGPLFAVTMLGVVLSQLLLAVALLRGGLGPRWVGAALVVWLVVEFVGSGVSPAAAYVSAPLMALVFGLLAVRLARSDIRLWMTATEADALADDEPARDGLGHAAPARAGSAS